MRRQNHRQKGRLICHAKEKIFINERTDVGKAVISKHAMNIIKSFTDTSTEKAIEKLRKDC